MVDRCIHELQTFDCESYFACMSSSRSCTAAYDIQFFQEANRLNDGEWMPAYGSDHLGRVHRPELVGRHKNWQSMFSSQKPFRNWRPSPQPFRPFSPRHGLCLPRHSDGYPQAIVSTMHMSEMFPFPESAGRFSDTTRHQAAGSGRAACVRLV